MKAGFDQANQLGNGNYQLSLPDAPHVYGRPYLDRTNFALTWFFINDHDNINRYLHAGSASAGCLTVGLNGTDSDIRRWTEIASLLLSQRDTTNSRFVGTLIVKNYVNTAFVQNHDI